MKKIIRLSETELKKIVKESVSNILGDDIVTGDSPIKYFYELYRLKVGEHQNQWESMCQSKLLYNTPEEAREAGIRYVEKQPFPCKGIVFRWELGKGGCPLGDESEDDEWTFYGGEDDYEPVYDYKRSEM